MRLLFIHAHPVPESFNTALCKAAVETARAQGHEVRLIDLCAEGFNRACHVWTCGNRGVGKKVR